MDGASRGMSNSTRSTFVARGVLILATAFLTASGIAACAGSHQPTVSWSTSAPSMPSMHSLSPSPAADMAAADAVWASRPAYTRADPRTEEAYAFALRSPDLLRWMPCYCGCAAMGHHSNLDCYFKPTTAGRVPTFEEHASGCTTCVDTTLMAKQLLAQGHSLRDVRDAIDRQFSGGAPGTPTELPPA